MINIRGSTTRMRKVQITACHMSPTKFVETSGPEVFFLERVSGESGFDNENRQWSSDSLRGKRCRGDFEWISIAACVRGKESEWRFLVEAVREWPGWEKERGVLVRFEVEEIKRKSFGKFWVPVMVAQKKAPGFRGKRLENFGYQWSAKEKCRGFWWGKFERKGKSDLVRHDIVKADPLGNKVKKRKAAEIWGIGVW